MCWVISCLLLSGFFSSQQSSTSCSPCAQGSFCKWVELECHTVSVFLTLFLFVTRTPESVWNFHNYLCVWKITYLTTRSSITCSHPMVLFASTDAPTHTRPVIQSLLWSFSRSYENLSGMYDHVPVDNESYRTGLGNIRWCVDSGARWPLSIPRCFVGFKDSKGDLEDPQARLDV